MQEPAHALHWRPAGARAWPASACATMARGCRKKSWAAWARVSTGWNNPCPASAWVWPRYVRSPPCMGAASNSKTPDPGSRSPFCFQTLQNRNVMVMKASRTAADALLICRMRSNKEASGEYQNQESAGLLVRRDVRAGGNWFRSGRDQVLHGHSRAHGTRLFPLLAGHLPGRAGGI